MNIKYLINNKSHKICFCPDKKGLKIRKKNKPDSNISNDLLKFYNDKKVLLIIDKNIDKKITKYLIHDLKVAVPNISVMMIGGSKKNKNLNFLLNILNFLLKKQFSKKSVIISCGGGVVGDVAGLASSLYLRGLIHLHIPTTMTAIIDSCIGGKTGINYNKIINSIGTYYHPQSVYISRNIIGLLPEREFIAGLPEILKYGLINNKKIIKYLNNKNAVLSRKFSYLSKIIKLSLETKIKLFKNDVTEEGERLKLNFGHTFDHSIEMALEKNSNKEILRHGEAVGLGMLCEIYYAYGKNKTFYLAKKMLHKYGLPSDLKNIIKKNKKTVIKKMIYNFVFLDKKRIGKYPRYIKIPQIGVAKVSEIENFKRIKTTIDKTLF